MFGKSDLHREGYQKFFDAILTRDWGRIETAVRQLCTQDCVLHHMRDPKHDETLDEYLDGYRRDSQKLLSERAVFEDCFSVGDMMAAHVVSEVVDKDTKQKSSGEIFIVGRFVGDRLAEEWVW
jgi:hypothetical protein